MDRLIDALLFSRMQDALDLRGVRTSIVSDGGICYNLYVNDELLMTNTKTICEREVMHLFLEHILNQEKNYDLVNTKYVYN
jgi:hypothetical protein